MDGSGELSFMMGSQAVINARDSFGSCMASDETQGGRAANQWVLPHRCPLNIVKKLTIFEVSSTD